MVPVNWLLERSRYVNWVKLPISTGIAPTSYIATNSIYEHELLQYAARHCAAARWEGSELLHNYSSSHGVTKFQKEKKYRPIYEDGYMIHGYTFIVLKLHFMRYCVYCRQTKSQIHMYASRSIRLTQNSICTSTTLVQADPCLQTHMETTRHEHEANKPIF